MKKIKKRGAIYGVIALLLCVAVYLNWSYVDTPDELLAADQTNPDSTETSGTAEDQDYFAASRLSREQARDEAVSTLKELSESETADQTAKDEAAAQISALAEDSVTEANIESMIRAKGYEDAVVMIGDESVNVVVAPPEGGLQATDVTVIKDIVVAEAGVTAGQIKIVEAE
ncbi:SpoIIIAH-like family protein [Agathobaculum sp.]|uniref:SpoIIIAH-like family protein n=1 Tax=Agathobaculum sp. TaxID=2048138 RepID=UPI001C3BC245|nr:SpoIIIAH-like family protein [Agathobaculum sp.]MBS6640485.1 SpoIIIAH-like family protein [Clostridiaceae bacterium]HIX11903.1 SpoIIIAH-like family protein [Candidatus Agathobaculum pullistercoris]